MGRESCIPAHIGHFCLFISEASSGDPFAFSTLMQPRCIKWMALIGLMVTL